LQNPTIIRKIKTAKTRACINESKEKSSQIEREGMDWVGIRVITRISNAHPIVKN
jgi:hypothetical protein